MPFVTSREVHFVLVVSIASRFSAWLAFWLCDNLCFCYLCRPGRTGIVIVAELTVLVFRSSVLLLSCFFLFFFFVLGEE